RRHSSKVPISRAWKSSPPSCRNSPAPTSQCRNGCLCQAPSELSDNRGLLARFEAAAAEEPRISLKRRAMPTLLFRWRHEHVANAAHSANGGGMRRIGLDLAAQAGDAQVYGAIERLHLAMCSHLQ